MARLAVRNLTSPLTAGPAALIGLLWFGFVAATNRWMGWEAGIQYANANDDRAYLLMAQASPGFPDDPIANQHAQRWVVHWLVGGIGDVVGLAPETVYRALAVILTLAVVAMLCHVLIALRAPTVTSILVIGALVGMPFVFRGYFIASGGTADAIFALALTWLMLGMLRRRLWMILAALLVGATARQTMVLVAPVVAAWLVLAPNSESDDRPWGTAAAVALLPGLLYFGLLAPIADGFSRPGASLKDLTIYGGLAGLPGTASDMVGHVARVAIVLFVSGGMLAASMLVVGRRALSPFFWGAFAVGVSIVGQALLLNPDPITNDYSLGNEPRLTAMALPALLTAFAVAHTRIVELEGLDPQRVRRFAMVGAGALAIGSFHQTYTWLSTGSSAITFVMQAAVGVALGLMILSAARPISIRDWGRRTPAAANP